jgi:putative heme-binding domain-containing protein
MKWAVPTLTVSLVLSLVSAAYCQRAPFPIPDPDPELERASFQVAEGFEVNLYAADPVLAKPIQMNFDPQGRLWVVSSEVYPQIVPGQVANDKVLVLEDRDGDGRADRTTVFADGLLIPTGIEPGDGGAYVANSTELLHFTDSDHDGKADRRRTMLSGFGTEDTHHLIHTLRWGYDGQLYFNQSVYIHSHVETPHGVRRLGGGGVWEFRPETMELEVFIRGLWNAWGHHFDRFGQSFVTDGAGFEGINYALPGASYPATPDALRIMHGLNPGSPKDCGAEFLSGRHLPEDWRGNLLTNDFRGNRVCRYVISEDGAGYAARERAELIKTAHVAFRPIDVKLGPDGAIYIADWYNPIIQHGEVDFRDARRDHTHGRIWRVTARGRPLVERPRLVDAPIESLLDALRAPEDWTRQQARRVLKERGAANVAAALTTWVHSLDRAKPNANANLEHDRLEALWTYQSLDVVEPGLLAQLLNAADPHVRAAAVRVLAHWHARLADADPLALLEPRVADEHPRVRLEAVRALGRIADIRAAALALRALERPVDRFLDYALWLTARELQPRWLPALAAGRFDFEGNPRHALFALQAVNTPEVVPPLLALLRAGRVPADQEDSVLTTIATHGQPNDLAVVFDLALSEPAAGAGLGPDRRAALMEALMEAASERKVRPAGDLSRLGRWLDGPDAVLRAAAARAAGLWKVEPLRVRLVALAEAGAGAVEPPVRRAALEGLARFGDRRALDRLAGSSGPPEAQPLAIAALATLDPAAAARHAVAWLGRLQPSEHDAVDDVIERIAELRGGPAALAAALAGKTLPKDVARMAMRAARSTGREDAALIQSLTRAGGLQETTRPLTPEETAALAARALAQGDPERGEAVYRRKESLCLKCHAISGAGGQVGPGLESLGASAPADYLADALLQPGKAVKEGFHAITVALNDGRVITGIKLRQTDTALVLRDAEDREVSLPLAAIEEQKPAGSLMPVGLVETMTESELLDLVKFLSELGKLGPYAISKARLFRRWEVLEMTPAVFQMIRRISLDAMLPSTSLTWSPAYSEVSGLLPLDAIPTMPHGPKADLPALAIARTQLDVSTGGPVQLAFNSTDGLTLWVDGTRTELRPETVLDLKPGIHLLTIAIDRDQRRDGLRVSLDDVAGSPARAQVVLGK